MNIVGRFVSYLDRKDREVVVQVVAAAIAPANLYSRNIISSVPKIPAGEWSLLVRTNDGRLTELRACEVWLPDETELRRLLKNQRRRKH